MAKRKKTLAELYVFNENQILSVMESITVHIKQLKSDLKYLNRKIAQANYINDPRNKTDETKDKIFTTTFERKECTLQDLIDIHIEKKHKISKLNNLYRINIMPKTKTTAKTTTPVSTSTTPAKTAGATKTKKVATPTEVVETPVVGLIPSAISQRFLWSSLSRMA